MTMHRALRLFAFGALIGPLSLAVAACGGNEVNEGGAEAVSGEPIEKIAPPEGQSWIETITKTDAGGVRMGNPDAPIKLVEFGSLTCPHCANFAETAGEELRETFVRSGRVSFEFRNFVINPLDLTMAMLVRCGAPESFFALTDQTFANQQDIVQKWTDAGEERARQAANLPSGKRYQAMAEMADLQEFFAARGIAADQANACLADEASAEQLVENTAKQSEEYGITGTPSFLINSRKMEGTTWPEIKAALEQAGAR